MSHAPQVRPGRSVPLPSPGTRFSIVFALDGAIAASCLWIALLLRFDGRIEAPYAQMLPMYSGILIGARLSANWAFRLHRWSFRLSGLPDGARIAFAGLLGTGLFVLGLYLLRRLEPPRSVVALELLMSTAAMASLRFAPRLGWVYWSELRRSRREDAQRTLIVGAGAAGEMLCRDLQRSREHGYQVVGFLDDDQAKWSSIVGGKRVLGPVSALPKIIDRRRISNVIIAIPRFSSEMVRKVLSLCAGRKVYIKILPVSFVYFHERGAAGMLQDLSPDDLLPRAPVSFAPNERAALAGRRILVTGAAGSIGSEICRQLLDADVGELTAVDINENGLYLLERRLRCAHPLARLGVHVADIRDAGRVEALLRHFTPQDVFHAAAHKHVPLMEMAPCEAVKNNVIATGHLLNAAERAKVECFIFISSDKAVAPSSVMGATKRIGEMMTRDVGHRSSVRCCAVRFGNVLGSDGSVVPLFRQQIASGGPVTITHPDARRYFMTIAEAVGLVLKAAYGRYGELCVLEMGEPISILDLARHMITMAGLVPDVDIPIAVMGLRPGEKLTEELLTEDEEVQVGAEGKIHIVSGPPPPADLWRYITELKAAAESEDSARVLALMSRVVPSYRPQTPGVRTSHVALEE